MALTELFFVLILTYQEQPQVTDFVRLDFETAEACLSAIDNLISAEEEYPVSDGNTIKHAVCVDRREGKPILEYRGILNIP